MSQVRIIRKIFFKKSFTFRFLMAGLMLCLFSKISQGADKPLLESKRESEHYKVTAVSFSSKNTGGKVQHKVRLRLISRENPPPVYDGSTSGGVVRLDHPFEFNKDSYLSVEMVGVGTYRARFLTKGSFFPDQGKRAKLVFDLDFDSTKAGVGPTVRIVPEDMKDM